MSAKKETEQNISLMYIFEKNFTLGDWAICDYTEAALKQLEIFPLVPDNRKRGGTSSIQTSVKGVSKTSL